MNKGLFTFAMSLSILDHLGRNLYRSFITVLGEAISNSWDADADNVWIYVDRDNDSLIIKDDGIGMTSDDFQHKFLKIGYSKRRKENKSKKGRYYIGRKGIGKLALLSCADRIHIISKIKNGDYVGGIIDNSKLDDAITEDMVASECPLEGMDISTVREYLKDYEHGTIIYFENITDGIKNSIEFLRKAVAFNFRFSLLDKSFNIFLDDKKITLDDLNDLANNTQFMWSINSFNDPFKEKLKNLKKDIKNIKMDGNTTGFIASVERPRNLKIINNEERVGIDLFVNGRIREKNILKRIPTNRLAEHYLYGQIHFNELDDEKDRFTSNREEIVPDDEKLKKFLYNLKKIISEILEDWDEWRIDIKEEGDPENARLKKTERNSINLFNAVSNEFSIISNNLEPDKKEKVDEWIDNLVDDAKYNLPSYTECFISENLLRRHIKENNISLDATTLSGVDKYKNKELKNKQQGNISIELRRDVSDMNYLDMTPLAKLIDPQREYPAGLFFDAKQYKPIRDALMHTALLTEEAKERLISIRKNIRSRIITLLTS